MNDQPIDSIDKFEKALRDEQTASYVLRLYIAGNTEKSVQAIIRLRGICETNLKGRYQLEIIDISQSPEMAMKEQIIATPTLIKSLPLPIRRIIGDLSKAERILIGLDVLQFKK